MPFEIDTENVERCITESYGKVHRAAEDNGVLNLFIASPIVAVSGSLPFEKFLELSYTDKDMIHQLVKEITRRNLLLIDAHFKNRNLDTIVTLGGSEQCTPPMMSPESFDEYVVPYDKLIVQRLKEYGIPVQCHCHGRIKHALPGMIEIGYDSTDPVEPPPAGDVTYAEARKLADGKITLLGNLEWDELEYSEPGYIRKRVRDILKTGTDRLILAASAGPISRITSKLADNYRAWIDTVNGF
jgi:uroporphyrinogen-III decarboxylase